MRRPEPMDDRRPAAHRVAVIGGGISGLGAAYFLMQASRERRVPLELRLFEAGARVGGQIRTERAEGVLLECGPDSLVAQKPAGQALCRRLGLSEELIHIKGGSSTLEVAHDGRLHPLPDGFALIGPGRLRPLWSSSLFSWQGKLRMSCERWLPTRPAEDESLRGFVTRRFGREAFQRAAEPILAALFTADADRLSLRMTIPRFLDLERTHGSVTAGLRKAREAGKASRSNGFHSLKSGMSELVRALASRLPGDAVVTGAPVRRLVSDATSGSWRVCRDGDVFDATAVILACPAHASAALVRDVDPRLADDLAGLHYASCHTVNLVYRSADIGRPPNSFGFFVPRTARLPILACNYMSHKFPGRAPRGQALFRVFLGGAGRAELSSHDDDQLVRIAHECLRPLLDLRREPLFGRVHHFPRSMPQFPVGYAQPVVQLRDRFARLPGLFTCGGALGAVGIPDCATSAEAAAGDALAFVASRARRLELAI